MAQKAVWEREDAEWRSLKLAVIEAIKGLNTQEDHRDRDTLARLSRILELPSAMHGVEEINLIAALPAEEAADVGSALLKDVMDEMSRRRIPALQLARELGVSRQQVSHWMRGRDRIGEKTRMRFMEWLRVSKTLEVGQQWPTSQIQ